MAWSRGAQARRPSLLAALILALAVVTPAALAPLAHAADPVSELAERYAPIVVVRDQPEPCGEGEPYLPSPVEAVLGHPDVVLRGPDGQAIASPTSADLAGKGDGWYVDLPGNPLSPGCDYETWFRSTSTQHVPTVYARVATDPAHPGMLALQYWFFWVFNDWNDRHEGDWEMVQLLFEADTVEAALAGAPASAAFAQHEGSETAAWTDDKLLRVGDRIVVYPGQGSHAAYYTQSQWFGKSAAAGFGCDDTTAEGIEVRPEVVVLPAATTPGFEWLDFTGRWGQQAPSFNNGPTGPNTKTQWAAPVTWQVEEGRDGAVALPVVGGPAVDSFCELTRAGSLLFIAALDQPLLVAALVLAAVVALVLLVRATRWRHGGDRQPDRERRAGQVVSASFGILFRSARALAPIMLTVGLATAGALALQRLALHRRPTGDLTDVNGLGDSGWAILLALLAAFALAPVVSVALAATCRVVEDLARESPSARLARHRPRGAPPVGGDRPAGPVLRRHAARILAVRPADRPRPHRLLGRGDAGGRDRGPGRDRRLPPQHRTDEGPALARRAPERPARVDRLQRPGRPGRPAAARHRVAVLGVERGRDRRGRDPAAVLGDRPDPAVLRLPAGGVAGRQASRHPRTAAVPGRRCP